jgi:hypothetical protein
VRGEIGVRGKVVGGCERVTGGNTVGWNVLKLDYISVNILIVMLRPSFTRCYQRKLFW